MIVNIVAILAGLILLTGLLGVIPAFGKHFERMAKWLGGFQGIIGLVAIGIGIWTFDFGLTSIMLIIAGLVLAAGFLEAIPSVGKHIHKVGTWLGGFQTIIGLITLAVGIWGFL